MSLVPGFGSGEYKDRFGGESSSKMSNIRIWKKLYSPEHTLQDPSNPNRLVYLHHGENELQRQVIYAFIL